MNKDRQPAMERFYQVIDDTIALFGQLIDFENKKLDAIAVNDVELLERHMHDEQAFLLKLRGLDQKREKLQEELGCTGATFRQMIEQAEGEERERLEERNAILTAKTEELKAAVNSTKKYIELHIHSIDLLLQKVEGETRTYDKNGEKTPPAPKGRFTPTKA